MVKYSPRKFDPFPHELVGRTLNVELEPGGCYLSTRAQNHIAKDHPTVWPIINAHVEKIVTNPTYIGQSPHHSNSFEMVKRIKIIELDEHERVMREYYVLVAISLEPDQHGDYRILSGYLLSDSQVENRRLNMHLLVPKRK